MSSILILRFLIILLAMLVAGTFGYMLARHRVTQSTAEQMAMMSAEVMKMRRRAKNTETEMKTALSHAARQQRIKSRR